MPSKLHPKQALSLSSEKTIFCPKGFSLIEIIVGLMMISVMAAMIFHATGGGLWQSAQGVTACREFFELQGQMEKITRIYKQRLAANNGTINLSDFQSDIAGEDYVNAAQTGYLSESGGNFTLTPGTTNLFLVTLVHGDQRCVSIFSQ